MCELCKNREARTYTHARSPQHKKYLIQYFKKIKSGIIKNHLSAKGFL